MTDYHKARDAFLASLVRSRHTIRNYKRGIDLFIGDHQDAPHFSPTPLPDLSADDISILNRFTQWMLDKRNLAPATVRLYMSGIKRWLEWMGVYDYLPADFPLTKALWALSDALAGRIFDVERKPPEPPEGIEQAVTYYESAQYAGVLHARLIEKPKLAQRLQLEMLRNRALLHVLAESGGRISEVLRLTVADFPPRAFTGDVWRVEVVGKGGHRYDLRFWDSLIHIRAYIEARQDNEPALFIFHSKRYGGRKMSRQAAWRVVDDARRTLGLGCIHPHDFRHWCASKLVAAGEPLDVIQDYLGHRSVETTRGYYAHTKAARVDAAAKKLRGE